MTETKYQHLSLETEYRMSGFRSLGFFYLILFRISNFVLRIYTIAGGAPQAPLLGASSKPRPLGVNSLRGGAHAEFSFQKTAAD